MSIVGTRTVGDKVIISVDAYPEFSAPAGSLVLYAGNLLYRGEEGDWRTLDTSSYHALFFGGDDGGVETTSVQSIIITTSGTVQDFDSMGIDVTEQAACSSVTRAVVAGGNRGSSVDWLMWTYHAVGSIISGYSTLNLTENKRLVAGFGSSIVGAFAGGNTGVRVKAIEKVTFASLADTTTDSDLTANRDLSAACASTTRALIGGGYESSEVSTIEYTPLATFANSVFFGNLTVARHNLASCSSKTRALFAGGHGNSTALNEIDYSTFATLGVATDFDDLSSQRYAIGGASSQTIGLFAGGFISNEVTTVDSAVIATTASSAVFGNLATARKYPAGCSNCHGSL